jgi:exopolyphosphatase
VDHNALAAGQAGLADAVTGVIDHHRDEGGFRAARPRLVEPVGSASTLVAAQLLEAEAAVVEPGLARLLLGTILLDTVNLDPEAKRATDKDVQVAARLAELCGADRQALFERLQFEKFNVDALDTPDLLRKDYKEYQMGAVRCGIASVLLPATRWLEKDPQLGESLAAFARGRELDLVLAMNAYTDPDFRRDLVVWAKDEGLFERVNAFLRDSDLDLEPFAVAGAGGGNFAVYSQGNAAYSRKKLQPLLQAFLGE